MIFDIFAIVVVINQKLKNSNLSERVRFLNCSFDLDFANWNIAICLNTALICKNSKIILTIPDIAKNMTKMIYCRFQMDVLYCSVQM